MKKLIRIIRLYLRLRLCNRIKNRKARWQLVWMVNDILQAKALYERMPALSGEDRKALYWEAIRTHIPYIDL